MKYRVPHFIPLMMISGLMIGCFAVFMTTTFSKNQQSYHELLDYINSFGVGQEIQAKQGRSGVKKEIWYNKNDQRLQVKMEGMSADVHFTNSSQGKEIVEHLKDVTAIVQEEVFLEDHQPKQKLKRFQAKTAKYNYSAQILIAYDVTIEEIVIPGDRIPDFFPSPMHLVHAKELEIRFIDGKFQADASGLSAYVRER